MDFAMESTHVLIAAALPSDNSQGSRQTTCNHHSYRQGQQQKTKRLDVWPKKHPLLGITNSNDIGTME